MKLGTNLVRLILKGCRLETEKQTFIVINIHNDLDVFSFKIYP